MLICRRTADVKSELPFAGYLLALTIIYLIVCLDYLASLSRHLSDSLYGSLSRISKVHQNLNNIIFPVVRYMFLIGCFPLYWMDIEGVCCLQCGLGLYLPSFIICYLLLGMDAISDDFFKLVFFLQWHSFVLGTTIYTFNVWSFVPEDSFFCSILIHPGLGCGHNWEFVKVCGTDLT